MCHGYHGHLARVSPAVAAVLVVVAIETMAIAQDASRFPKPDRPVARIIAPSYSTEEIRDRHGEAERVMDRLGIKPGLCVADVGAGDGYYTVRLARRLGPAATIYAQDVEPRYLRGLLKRLEREGIRGVTAVQGTPGNPKLPRDSVALRCELATLGYREVDFVSLAPADGYLAVFTPPETLPAPGSIRPCTP